MPKLPDGGGKLGAVPFFFEADVHRAHQDPVGQDHVAEVEGLDEDAILILVGVAFVFVEDWYFANVVHLVKPAILGAFVFFCDVLVVISSVFVSW